VVITLVIVSVEDKIQSSACHSKRNNIKWYYNQTRIQESIISI